MKLLLFTSVLSLLFIGVYYLGCWVAWRVEKAPQRRHKREFLLWKEILRRYTKDFHGKFTPQDSAAKVGEVLEYVNQAMKHLRK